MDAFGRFCRGHLVIIIAVSVVTVKVHARRVRGEHTPHTLEERRVDRSTVSNARNENLSKDRHLGAPRKTDVLGGGKSTVQYFFDEI